MSPPCDIHIHSTILGSLDLSHFAHLKSLFAYGKEGEPLISREWCHFHDFLSLELGVPVRNGVRTPVDSPTTRKFSLVGVATVRR